MKTLLKSFAAFIVVVGISSMGAANTALAGGHSSHGSSSHASSGSSHSHGSHSSHQFDKHDSHNYDHRWDKGSYCHSNYGCRPCYQPCYTPSDSCEYVPQPCVQEYCAPPCEE